jgi:hypothetical protein
MNMTDVTNLKKRMLILGIVSAAILIGLTVLCALKFSTLEKSGMILYMMAVPIFMTVLAFVFGYVDLNERMDEDEITYMLRRTFIFGGVMFSITLIAELALYLST